MYLLPEHNVQLEQILPDNMKNKHQVSEQTNFKITVLVRKLDIDIKKFQCHCVLKMKIYNILDGSRFQSQIKSIDKEIVRRF